MERELPVRRHPIIRAREGRRSDRIAAESPSSVVDGMNGLVFDPAEPAALANAMRTLWNDPERAVAMGRSAKAFADAEFNDQKFLDTLVGIYQELIHGDAGSAAVAARP